MSTPSTPLLGDRRALSRRLAALGLLLACLPSALATGALSARAAKQGLALVARARVGVAPAALALDPSSGHVFVLGSGPTDARGNPTGPGSVTTIDARSGAVLRTTSVGDYPFAMAIDPATSRLFVVGGNQVLMLDTTSGALVRSVSLNMAVMEVAIDRREGHVFVANPLQSTIGVLDAATDDLVGSIRLAGPVADMWPDEKTERLFVLIGATLSRDQHLSLVDSRSGHVIVAHVALPFAPYGVAVNEATGTAFAFSAAGQADGAILNGSTGHAGPALALDGMANTAVVDANRGLLYVLANTVGVRRMATGQLLRRVHLVIAATALAVDIGSGRVYLMSPADAAVQSLDGPNGMLGPRMGVGANPTAMAIDPGNHRLYVASALAERNGTPTGPGLLATYAIPAAPVMIGPPSAPLSRLNACVGAGVALNAVVRFYLALDRHEYEAARGCLDPRLASQLPAASFAAGYRDTVSTRLVMVASADNGTLASAATARIWLRGYDRAAPGLLERRFTGRWRATPDGHLTGAGIQPLGGATPMAVPAPLSVPAALDQAGLFVLASSHLAIDPRAAPASVYIISGKGCASCHGQQILIYQSGRLVFAEANTDVNWVRLAGGTLRILAGRTIDGYRTETWRLTPYGFVLEQPCVLVRTEDVGSNSLDLGADTFPAGARRSEVDTMRTAADLRSYGLLTGMDKDFPGFGYVGGCAETWMLAGAEHVTAQVQTDAFSGRRGGQTAYDWDKGLAPSDVSSFRIMALQPPNDAISAEAITYTDTTNQDRNLRGTWLLAHLRQGEILISVTLQTAAADPAAYRRLQATFAYSQDAFFAHLGALSIDWFTPPAG